MNLFEKISSIIPEFTLFDKESDDVKEKINKYLITEFEDFNDLDQYQTIHMYENQNHNIYELVARCAIIYCSFESLKELFYISGHKITIDCWHLIGAIHHRSSYSDFCESINFLVPYIDFSNLDDGAICNLSGYCFDTRKDNIFLDIKIILDKGEMTNKNRLLQQFFKDCFQYGELDLYIELLDYGIPDNIYEVFYINIDYNGYIQEVYEKCLKPFLISLYQKQINLSIVYKSKFISGLPNDVMENIYSLV